MDPSRLLLAPLVVALAACGGSGPGETPPVPPLAYGRYDLVTHFGRPLPDTLAFLVTSQDTSGSGARSLCPELLLSVTLDAAPDGTLRRTTRLGYPCPASLPSYVHDSATVVETGHVTIAGDSVALSFGDGTPGTPPSSVEYAHVSGDELSIYLMRTNPDLSAEYPAQPIVYRHE